MDLSVISNISTIVGTVVSIISLILSSTILIKVRRLTDESKNISQSAKGDNNKQRAKIK